MDKILSAKPGEKVILLGNEAIIRGALESGVDFVSTYPGTPASEIGNIFSKIAKEAGIYFEFSTNEKVALEVGIGASFSNLKTLVAMKNFGLNVCLDSFIPFVYTGTKGPTVIVVADDPSCHSSAQSEQNTRPVSFMSHIPTLEPADPQECLEFTKLAFEISEKFNIPVLLRTTTRVAHQSAQVNLGQVRKPETIGQFVRDQKRFVTMPPRVLEMKKELFDKIEKIKDFAENSPVNRIEGKKSEIGIIASGVSYLYVKEALKGLDLDLPILKLGIFYPISKKKVEDFIKGLKKVLIAEELEGFLEDMARGLAKDVNPKLEIHGKDLLPVIGELKPEYVASAIAKIAGKKYELPNTNKITLKHLPRFCPGCPYNFVFPTVKRAAPEGTVFGGDIGCYMLGSVAPQSLYDYLFSMGSSIGIGHGVAKATKQKAITFIGDSTFFHAGIPALLNTVFNKSNPIVIILDNGTTAMTGHQPNPGTSIRNESEYKFEWEGYEANKNTPESPIKMEEIIRACGVKNLKVVDSFNPKQIEEAIKEFLPKPEVSVIIARGICALLAKKI